MQLFRFASEKSNLGPLRLRPQTFSFADVVALFSLDPFRFSFTIFPSFSVSEVRCVFVWYCNLITFAETV